MDGDYDWRQFNMMMSKIRAFERGELGYLDLEADLSALIEVLRGADEGRKNELRSICNRMDALIAIVHNEVGFARNDRERAEFRKLVGQFKDSIVREL